MALVETDMFEQKRDKIEAAIQRIYAFCPDDGYYVAFSGGKDSVVIKVLCDMAGVRYDAHYNVTTVDPPELVRFIREKYPDVIFERPEMSMRQLIIKKQIPPTRLARYCCEQLKERYGTGRVVMTGVRWAESRNRKNNHGVVTFFNGGQAREAAEKFGVDFRNTGRGGLILNMDNAPARRTVEHCYRTGKTLVNPIVDWTDEDIWQFIKSNNVSYCSLYDEGFKRIGCIGCPLGGANSMHKEFKRWPQYKRMYIRAFDDMLEARRASGKTIDKSWADGDAVFRWWVSGKKIADRGQIDMAEFIDDENEEEGEDETMTDTERDNYTAAEAAKRLGITATTVYRLIDEDPGFPVIRIGKRMLIPKERFEKWAAGRRMIAESGGAVRP